MSSKKHAAHLREMADYKIALSKNELPPPRSIVMNAKTIEEMHNADAAALLAGVEALERLEEADKAWNKDA